MRLYEIIAQPVDASHAIHYDPTNNKIKFKDEHVRVTLKVLNRIRHLKAKGKKNRAVKSKLLNLIYGREDIQVNSVETEVTPSAADKHLTQMALGHIRRRKRGGKKPLKGNSSLHINSAKSQKGLPVLA